MYFLLDLYRILTSKQRKRFFLLQLMVITMALLEVIGVASIVPFMTLVGDVDLLEKENIVSYVYSLSGLGSKWDFLIALGFVVLFFLFLSALISILTIWKLSMFATGIGAEISNKLYRYYMSESWLFHSQNSSSNLTKGLSVEVQRLTASILIPIMTLNSRVVMALFMSLALLIYNPIVTLVAVTVFGAVYYFLFRFVKSRIFNNGQVVSTQSAEKFRLMSEGFGGIKDFILTGRKNFYLDSFENSSTDIAKAQGENVAVSQIPRYFLELIAFGMLISLVIYLLISNRGDVNSILPMLALYAMAGLKLLPAYQQIYANIAKITGNISSFYSIRENLLSSEMKPDVIEADESAVHLKKSLRVENVSFKYPKKERYALSQISLDIKANSMVAFVGLSGSGKSTLVDILLGLINPEVGNVLIDEVKLDSNNIKNWQKTIGFVPQNIFLTEGTIAENVAFGISASEVDYEKVSRAIIQAQLEDLLNTLPDKENTRVGERGVQLSGGQRQRIGIARALYNDPNVLVFDEATSALDAITEDYIMKAVSGLSKKKTIIMVAHRIKTVEKCDQIYLMKNGKVIDSGSYENLLNCNDEFRKMALYI